MMDRQIFSYLKRKGITDTRIVNRLFVSAFLRYYDCVPVNNRILVGYYISNDDPDMEDLYDFVRQLSKYGCDYSLETLTNLFEYVISPVDRKISGAVYTPEYIRERIVEEATSSFSDKEIYSKRFADISCGCGGFFLTIVQLLQKRCNKKITDIIQENIYGIDIQDYSIERTKLLLSILAVINGEDNELNFNLFQANTLEFDFSQIGRIDIIVGNPPYVCVRNMSSDSRKLLANWEVCKSGNSDLYIPFFQIAIENIHEGGRIGFITMNSFLCSLNGRSLREYFQKHRYNISIVDFRGAQLFKGKNTYTCLFFLTKESSDAIKYLVSPSTVIPNTFTFSSIKYDLLDSKSGWRLNAYSGVSQVENIGLPLGRYCKTSHGIATLSNKTYVFVPVKENINTYSFVKDNHIYNIEKSICRDIINSNRFNVGSELIDVVEKVIFPYIKDEFGRIQLMEEDYLKEQYPLAYSYLASQKTVLDSRDKGNTNSYQKWYAYGRTQSLSMPKHILFVPKIANKQLRCILCVNSKYLLYNGFSFVSDDEETLQVLKRILESDIFWNYVQANCKPYTLGYYSVNGIGIKHFGIPCFSKEEKKALVSMNEQCVINKWLRRFYPSQPCE